MSQHLFGQETGHKKVSKTTYLVLTLALGAMTFFGVCSPQGQLGNLPGIAGSVAGEEISQQEFIRAYEMQSEHFRKQYGEDYNPAALKVAQTVLNQLISDRILYLQALELGFQATDNEVVNYLSSLDAFTNEQGVYSEEQFVRFLRGNRYSEASFMEELRRSLTLQKLRQTITSTAFASQKAVEFDYKLTETKVDVEYIKFSGDTMAAEVSAEEVANFLKEESSEDKIKAWYQAHTSDYSQPEKVHARHILISHKDARNAPASASQRSEEEARQRAESLLKRLQEGASNFAELAMQESDEPAGKKSGGDLGFFSRESMVKEFSDAAFALEAGQTSGIVASPFGFHIIRLEAKQAAKETPLEEARPEIARKLILQDKGPKLAEQRAQTFLDLLTQGKSGEEFLSQHKLSWSKTGPLPITARYIPGLGAQQEIKDAILTLNADHRLYDKLVKVAQNFIVLRLANITQADWGSVAPEKRQQLTASTVFSQGYGFLTGFESWAQKEYEKAGKIYKSAEYLALDTAKESE